jgi:hypothetical protein
MEYFSKAVGKVVKYFGQDKIEVEYMTLSNFRTLHWSLEQLVSWLLASRIHFIIAHFHQGWDNLGYSIEHIYFQLQRLMHHEGFPYSNQLKCFIFTQDKIKYLKALPEGTTLPTFPIPMAPDMDMAEMEALIAR